MILPTKHIPLERTLLAHGGQLLSRLSAPKTVSLLWHEARKDHVVESFDRYVLALDLLYIMGLIRHEDGLLDRVFE